MPWTLLLLQRALKQYDLFCDLCSSCTSRIIHMEDPDDYETTTDTEYNSVDYATENATSLIFKATLQDLKCAQDRWKKSRELVLRKGSVALNDPLLFAGLHIPVGTWKAPTGAVEDGMWLKGIQEQLNTCVSDDERAVIAKRAVPYVRHRWESNRPKSRHSK